METITIFLLPVTISFFLYPFVRHFLGQHLPRVEQMILTMMGSLSITIIALSWYATLIPSHFSLFAKILFLLTVILSYPAFRAIVKYKLSVKLSRVQKLIVFILVILVLKTIILYFLHPVIDPDVIYLYLPYARSIIRAGFAPAKDYFTGSPMMIPPIGMPSLFAFSYIISGSIFSESFKLLTLPAFLGILTLIYLFARKLTNRTYSLLTVVIFLTLPIIDSLLIGWTLYPDIIFAFLGLGTLYFTIHPIINNSRRTLFIGTVQGLSLAAAVLLKNQGIFLAYSLAVIIISRLVSAKKLPIGLFFAVVLGPFLGYFYQKSGITSFGYPPLSLIALFCLLTITLVYASFCLVRSAKRNSPQSLSQLVLILLIFPLGFIWQWRNNMLYNNITVPLTHEFNTLRGIKNTLNIALSAQRDSGSIFAIFFAIPFGSFFLVPKLLGFIQAIKNKPLAIHAFWFVYWYAIILLYFGELNDRYIFIAFPSLAIIISFGISQIVSWFRSKHRDLLAITFVLILALASLFQSEIILWNFGPAFSFKNQPTHSNSSTPITSNSQSSSPELTKYQESAITFTRKQLRSFNQFLILSNNKLTEGSSINRSIITITMIGSLLVILLFYSLSRLSRSHKIDFYLYFMSLFLILPYVFIIMRITDHNPGQFSQFEKTTIYHNFGEVNYITPYLLSHDQNSSIVIIGPPTGIAYQAHMRTYNLKYGYGLIKIGSLIQSSVEEILDFMAKNEINYIVVSTHPDQKRYLESLRFNSNLLEVIENKQYFSVVVSENPANSWRLYARNH